MSTAFFTTVSPAFSLVDRHYYDVILDVDRLFETAKKNMLLYLNFPQSDVNATVYETLKLFISSSASRLINSPQNR